MPEEKRQNLAETDRRSYFNQEFEEFLDDKGEIYNGKKQLLKVFCKKRRS